MTERNASHDGSAADGDGRSTGDGESGSDAEGQSTGDGDGRFTAEGHSRFDGDGRSAAEGTGRGELRAAISTEIVKLHRQYYGRGPTRARTYIQSDLVVCILSDIFTTVERTLLETGHVDQVRSTRFVFQQAMEERFSRAVEDVVGRKVIAFMSQTHIEPDLAVEIFVLEPEADQSFSGE